MTEGRPRRRKRRPNVAVDGDVGRVKHENVNTVDGIVYSEEPSNKDRSDLDDDKRAKAKDKSAAVRSAGDSVGDSKVATGVAETMDVKDPKDGVHDHDRTITNGNGGDKLGKEVSSAVKKGESASPKGKQRAMRKEHVTPVTDVDAESTMSTALKSPLQPRGERGKQTDNKEESRGKEHGIFAGTGVPDVEAEAENVVAKCGLEREMSTDLGNASRSKLEEPLNIAQAQSSVGAGNGLTVESRSSDETAEALAFKNRTDYTNSLGGVPVNVKRLTSKSKKDSRKKVHVKAHRPETERLDHDNDFKVCERTRFCVPRP